VFSQLVPLSAHIWPQRRQVQLDLRSDACGLRLAHVRLAHLHHGNAGGRHRHARPAAEGDAALQLRVWPGRDAREHIRQNLLHLVGGLEAEEVEVAQQVVVQREELQVELGQREAAVGRIGSGWHHALVPEHLLVGVERHLGDVLPLAAPPLVGAQQQLRQERGVCCVWVIRAGQLQLAHHETRERLRGQRLQVLQQRRALVDGAAVCERQRAERRDVLERQPLELQQPLVIGRGNVVVAQSGARVVVDLEAQVEAEHVAELRKEATLGVRKQPGEAALGEQAAVVEQRAHEAPRGQLGEQVDEELEEAL
jgi:hypothetical protein